MSILEYRKILNMNYNEAIEYLKEKHGLVKEDYYKKDSYKRYCKGEIKNPGKNTSIIRVKEGLYIHHTHEVGCEALANINKNTFTARFRTHKKENLVYCNIIEHMILHHLIDCTVGAANLSEVDIKVDSHMSFRSSLNSDGHYLRSQYIEWFIKDKIPALKWQIPSKDIIQITPEEAKSLLQEIDTRINNFIPKEELEKEKLERNKINTEIKRVMDKIGKEYNEDIYNDYLYYGNEIYDTTIIFKFANMLRKIDENNSYNCKNEVDAKIYISLLLGGFIIIEENDKVVVSFQIKKFMSDCNIYKDRIDSMNLNESWDISAKLSSLKSTLRDLDIFMSNWKYSYEDLVKELNVRSRSINNSVNELEDSISNIKVHVYQMEILKNNASYFYEDSLKRLYKNLDINKTSDNLQKEIERIIDKTGLEFNGEIYNKEVILKFIEVIVYASVIESEVTYDCKNEFDAKVYISSLLFSHNTKLEIFKLISILTNIK